jgi:predicted ATPase
MRITKIEIQNYKSIEESVGISFYNGLPTVLIGKNGSGKTNILEALDAIAEANGNYLGLLEKLTLSYKVHIRLEKEDAEKLFPGKSIDEKFEFVACSGENCKINRIESEYFALLLKSEIEEMIALGNELKDALNTYKEQLRRIACNDFNEQSLRGYRITDFHDSTTNYDTLKFLVNAVLEQTEKLAESLLHDFCIDGYSFKFGNFYYLYWPRDLERLFFKLCYVKPDLAPFEENFITINETAIKGEITKINKETKVSCEKITVLLHELDERAKRLKAALSDDQIIPDNCSVFYKFIREVRKCVGAKCAFLRNESSEVIFKTDDPKHVYFRRDKSHVILQTYLNRVYTGPDKDEIQKYISENKGFSLSEAALNEFEKYLNEHIPEFENGMYDRISVEQSDAKLPSILLHEKNGEIVNLNLTSAGRRWYFTYYFMKNTLENGDLFIIDEPATMLHPLAQKEVLKELLQLESRGIKVIYSTHSPYLIPDDWKSVHFVAMTDVGTTVTQENKYDALKQVVGGDIFDLQELLERYQECGSVGAAHNCYKALMHKYGSIEEAAKNLPFSYDTIESWKKKKRGTLLENVINIANAIAVSPKELL